mgnify:CR=1 FL=1
MSFPSFMFGKSRFKGGISSLSSRYFVDVQATLAAAVGNNTASFNGAIRGMIKGAALTKTNVVQAGVHGVYWVTSTNASTWPTAAVIGEIHDGTTTADAAVLALVGGDSNTATAGAAFGVVSMNSTSATPFTYGLDLSPAALGAFLRVNFANADIRLSNDVVVKPGTGAPADGVSGTGAGFAGPGSLYVNISDGKWYTNTNTKASPTWTVVGSQA